MTDHLEPYRRMARSLRFVPPVWETAHLYRAMTRVTGPSFSVSPVAYSSIDYLWSVKEPPADLEPSSDPSQRAADLIRAAVSKPSVFPVPYVIQENIGDRISKLTASDPAVPTILTAEHVAADDVAPHAVPRSGWTPTQHELVADKVSPALKALPAASSAPLVLEPVLLETDQPEEPMPVEETLLYDESDGLEPAWKSETHAVPVEQAVPEIEEAIASLDNSDSSDHSVASDDSVVSEAFAIGNPVKVVSGWFESVTDYLENVTQTLTGQEPPVADEVGTVECPQCSSNATRKDGRRSGKQKYLCQVCGKQFTTEEISAVSPQPPAKKRVKGFGKKQ